ncbi:putative phosphoribosyl transferase [Paraburkholderia bannensis]|uniref:Putative phosphoribosyl transferase n=1 Tax=Paraburkholderia bannensis TaxID=765414 RepID=A0A7W9TUQ9_9BURK|nr:MULTISPECIES: phosphoribosyltransferase family protein [Paraburkholderia]MBB3256693.1 putative phosphoribosyl transferase [Paraburkholderia sp. WP4_3_2]MBB6101692.1 putative phosphoribosyl transferase [Paraburkholderia bannensis]
MERSFTDRRDAGRLLAAQLVAPYGARRDVAVLALPRGGVPVAFEVARALGAPLDVLPVCKLGVPWQPELAMGALSSNGAQYVDEALIREAGVSEPQLQSALALARIELGRREARYRGERAPIPVAGRVALLIDDGMATGASLKAAALALASLGPARIVAALPVAPAGARERLAGIVDDLVCVKMPLSFMSVGQFYADFDQVDDETVRDLLHRAASDGGSSGESP